MSENLDHNKKKRDAVLYQRHSKANYDTYTQIKASDNPQAGLDPEKQLYPDLPEAGVQLAKEEAGKLLSTLDPEHDELFFVSSNLSRALETAAIYRDIAKEKGFTVIDPHHEKREHRDGGFAEKVGGGEIRVLDTLSLVNTNTLVEDVFTPDKYATPVNWDGVPQDIREKWELAHSIIQADDRGSWGANMFHHAEEIKRIFPEIKTSQELYEKEFKNLLRLARFGLKKAQEHPKNIKIFAFGHENYVGYALQKYFNDHEIKNCESITIEAAKDGGLSIERRGQQASIE